MMRSVDEWKSRIKPALDSKTSEMKLLGYRQATNDDIWNCLVQKVWKGNPSKHLYEVIQDIFHLPTNVYMSYLTLEAYQDEDLMASIAALTIDEKAAE
ncbi:post-transcriptional regulator [Lentibacillus songyuanensis]|uniref:post-transcriptional regulator n=1 Tax=Lentibacillus songyuanensis TaxID=3136161 RepID=UPI0031B9BDF9